MANVNPISSVEFGKERTARQMRDRAQWERNQAAEIRAAKRPIGWEHIVDAHEQTARAYEQASRKRDHEESGAQPTRSRGHAAVKSERRALKDYQLAALRTFAQANGRNWKSALNHAWSTGRYQDYNGADDVGALQEIRNYFGPSWLVRFSFTKQPASAQSHATRRGAPTYARKALAFGDPKYVIEHTPRAGHSKGTHASYRSKQAALKAAKRLANEKNGRVEVAHIDENHDRHFVTEVYPSGR